jgi:hypothetical protein
MTHKFLYELKTQEAQNSNNINGYSLKPSGKNIYHLL